MWQFALLARVDRAIGPGSARRRLRRPGRRANTAFRPGGDPLEDRALLATVTVHVMNNAFSQPSVTIHPNDTIHWVWDSGGHSTTSVAGIAESWNSGVHSPAFTFDHTFTHTGSFPYYCTIHGFDNGDGTAGGMSGTIIVTPSSTTAPTLQSIAVTPANPTIAPGATQQFVAMGTFSDSTTQDLTTKVTWASSATAVATISGTGLATGVADGTSTITATMGGVSRNTVLTVNHSASPTPTPTTPSPTPTTPSPTPTAPPHLTGTVATTHSKKGLAMVVVAFDEPLDPASANQTSHYTLRAGVKKRGKTAFTKPLRIGNVAYDDHMHTVMIMLARPFKGTAQLTVHAGIAGANGLTTGGDSVLVVK
jgi:plastocyanin